MTVIMEHYMMSQQELQMMTNRKSNGFDDWVEEQMDIHDNGS